MEALSLFKIGFRCENIRQELQKYSTNKTFNKMIIEESDCIINESFDLSTPLASNMLASSSRHIQMMPLILEALHENSVQAFNNRLTRILQTIQRVKTDEHNVDVQEAVEFFTNLSNLCLSRNTLAQLNVSFAAH